jgi:transposase-like protein
MARCLAHRIEFRRPVVREYRAGDVSLHGLAERHRTCRSLVRLWLSKYEAGEFTEKAAMASSLEEYQARVAALGRKVGQLTVENDPLKETLPGSRSPGGAYRGDLRSLCRVRLPARDAPTAVRAADGQPQACRAHCARARLEG